MQPGQPAPHCHTSRHSTTPGATDSCCATRRLNCLGAVWWPTATAAATLTAAATAAAAAAAAAAEHRKLTLSFPPAPRDLNSGGGGDLHSPQLHRHLSRRAPTSLPARCAATHVATRAACCAARCAAPHLHAPPSCQAAPASAQRTAWPAGQQGEAV
eukprot:scaffold49424_cov61-Phaeocystis_antarctica.AAC.1